MWHRSINRGLLGLWLLLLPLTAWAAPQTIEGEVRWQGEVRLAGPVLVKSGATLVITAGTRLVAETAEAKLSIQGRLLVQGSEAKPVRFATPAGWLGIEFIEAAAGSVIEHARFADCQQAISCIATSPQIRHNRFRNCEAAIKLLRESAALIEGNDFADNRVGLGVEMRSSPKVLNNRFRNHGRSALIASNNSRGLIEGNLFEKNQQGVALLQKFPDRVHGNRFIDNQTGLYCYQTQNTPLIENNLFQGNEYGLVNFSFAFPAVRNNRFVDNQTAMQNDQFGSTLVERNLFKGNGTALFNNRKSNPKVRQNLFEENGLAIFCDYSSYPEVRQNNFLGNRMGAKLGIYQSADWERRSGSQGLVRQQAMARGSKNPMLAQAPTEFKDRVDLSGNWWGESTAQLVKVGAEGNLELFHDRHDQPTVSYEGYGTDSYRLDLIVFAPWLEQPVAVVGPESAP